MVQLILEYTLGVLVFAGVFTLLYILKTYLVKQARQVAEHTENHFDDEVVAVADSLTMPFLFVVAAYLGLQTVYLPEVWHDIATKAFITILAFQFIFSLGTLLHKLTDRAVKIKDKQVRMAYRTLIQLVSMGMWVLGGLFLLSNLGINVTTFLAGLGIGGIAVAFAMQNILRDLFSYFTILFDKPIRDGDIIEIGGRQGTVQKIGMRTTRVKMVGGEELVVANDDIASQQLVNYGKAKKRRVKIEFSLDTKTKSKKLADLPALVENIVTAIDYPGYQVMFQRCHFRHMTSSGFEFHIIYQINSMDYNPYLDINQTILLEILATLEKQKLHLASSPVIVTQ